MRKERYDSAATPFASLDEKLTCKDHHGSDYVFLQVKFSIRKMVMTRLPGLQTEHGKGPLKCWMCHRNFIVLGATGKNGIAIVKRVHSNS